MNTPENPSPEEMDIDQIQPTIERLTDQQWEVLNKSISTLQNSEDGEPTLDEELENDFLSLFEDTKPTPNWVEKYQREQKKTKREVRENVDYEGEATSEEAQIENLGNIEVKINEIPKVCQWSPNNKLTHVQYGKKGLLDIMATFKGIEFDPLVDEYVVRNVLIRANPAQRQYPG